MNFQQNLANKKIRIFLIVYLIDTCCNARFKL